MATQSDAITEARNNLTSIDKEIDAIMEQITTLQAKVDNLRSTKRQDEAFIRIVEMREQGKDLSSLLDAPKARSAARQDRGAATPAYREPRGPRGNSSAVVDATRALLEKETALGIKDIVKHLMDTDVQLTGKDDAGRIRNTENALLRGDRGFRKENGLITIA